MRLPTTPPTAPAAAPCPACPKTAPPASPAAAPTTPRVAAPATALDRDRCRLSQRRFGAFHRIVDILSRNFGPHRGLDSHWKTVSASESHIPEIPSRSERNIALPIVRFVGMKAASHSLCACLEIGPISWGEHRVPIAIRQLFSRPICKCWYRRFRRFFCRFFLRFCLHRLLRMKLADTANQREENKQ